MFTLSNNTIRENILGARLHELDGEWVLHVQSKLTQGGVSVKELALQTLEGKPGPKWLVLENPLTNWIKTVRLEELPRVVLRAVGTQPMDRFFIFNPSDFQQAPLDTDAQSKRIAELFRESDNPTFHTLKRRAQSLNINLFGRDERTGQVFAL